MAHRRAGECERCNDIGRHGRKATHVATPLVPRWPAFRACLPCALELLEWPDGEPRIERPYDVVGLPGVAS